MTDETFWLHVPGMFDVGVLDDLAAAFAERGVEWASKPLLEAGAPPEASAHVLHVNKEHAAAAVSVLCVLLELEDPEQLQPFEGPCPACGHEVQSAWACPECELGFGARHKSDDPLITFVREHGGFAGD